MVVGVAFLAVAAASATSLYLWPTTSGSTRTTTTDVPPTLSGPSQTREALLVGMNTSSGSFTVSWQSSVRFEVTLYAAYTCSSAGPDCRYGPQIAEWPSNVTGRWGAHGDLQFPYLLVWSVVGGIPGSLQASSISTFAVSSAPPVWATLATIGALVSVGAVGVIAFFLGVFLRGGVYQRPPRRPPGNWPEPSPTEGLTDPRTGSPDDAGGSPPRGPPARGP